MTLCDNWVVLKIQPEASGEQEVFYKLLQGFSGSYTYGNSWHMNSGIEKVVLLRSGEREEGACGGAD